MIEAKVIVRNPDATFGPTVVDINAPRVLYVANANGSGLPPEYRSIKSAIHFGGQEPLYCTEPRKDIVAKIEHELQVPIVVEQSQPPWA